MTLSFLALSYVPSTGLQQTHSGVQQLSQQFTPPLTSTYLSLNTSAYPFSSGTVDSNGGYAYFGTTRSPATIFKIRLSDFTNLANVTLATGEAGAMSAVFDPNTKSVFFGTLTHQIVKIDLATFTEASRITLPPGPAGIVISAAIDADNGFAYFGTSSGAVVKIRTSDFTINNTLTIESSAAVGGVTVDRVNGYGYFAASGCGPDGVPSTPNRIVKVRLSDFSIEQSIDPGGGCFSSADIDQGAGYVYFDNRTLSGGQIIGGNVVRFSMSDLSQLGSLSPPQQGFPISFGLNTAQGLAYTVGGATVSVFRLSDLAQIDSGHLQPPASNIISQTGITVDQLMGYAYFASSNWANATSQPGIVRIAYYQAPVLTIGTISPTPALAGQLVTLSFVAIDPNRGSKCSINWGDGTVTQTLPCEDRTATHTYTNSGLYVIRVTMVDDARWTVQQTPSLRVDAQPLPAAKIFGIAQPLFYSLIVAVAVAIVGLTVAVLAKKKRSPVTG